METKIHYVLKQKGGQKFLSEMDDGYNYLCFLTDNIKNAVLFNSAPTQEDLSYYVNVPALSQFEVVKVKETVKFEIIG